MNAAKRGARVETAAMLIAVFIAGGLGGAALERHSHDHERFDNRRGGFLGAPGSIPRFYEELDLTAEQRSEIHRILEGARPETDSLLRTALPRLRELTHATREAIAGVLTDEQRARLEAHFRERRDRYRGQEGARPEGHRGPHD